MEMNFPHNALRHDSDISQKDRQSALDAARLRQANSRTVRFLHQADQGGAPEPDDLAARIQCFAAAPNAERAVGGPFWQKSRPEKTDKPPVYQTALGNIKGRLLPIDATGTELTLAGHGAGKES
ncbi:MAG: hypothetical protein RLZZ103_1894 [Pseudomonadota bacterium]|jgi:hypothetical protein